MRAFTAVKAAKSIVAQKILWGIAPVACTAGIFRTEVGKK
jgi:hypothetical protein